MDRRKQENFRKFEGYLKILSIRARFTNDEREEEYKTILDKLEKIKNNRHLAMITEENEESIMYLKLLDLVQGYDEENYDIIYDSVRELLDNYELKECREVDEKDIGEER